MLKVPYQKLRLKCKGSLNNNSNFILCLGEIGKRIVQGIPVLSIFALLGISVYMLNAASFSLIAIIDPENTNKVYAAENTDINPSASLTIDNDTIKDNITAVRGDVAYVSHNIRVDASDIESYALTITGPTKLTGGTAINGAGNKTPANMANNTWGYAWGAKTATESSMAYQSFTGSAQTLAGDTVTNNQVGFDRKLAFAAKFGTDAAEGHYTASVNLNLTVTPKAITLDDISIMQEMYDDNNNGISTICKNSAVGESNTLIDSRDNNTYTVAKLSDEKCWMTQNLRLASNTKLTSEKSDVVTDFTLPASTTSSFSSSYTGVQMRDSADNDYGAYYNWCAATANTCSSSTPANSSVAGSICPKGWKLPTGGPNGDFQALLTIYPSNAPQDFATQNGKNGFWLGGDSTAKGGAFFVAAGTVGSSGLTVGNHSFYRSRTVSSSTYQSIYLPYYLTVGKNSLSGGNYNSFNQGYPIRCVAYSN